MCRPDHDRFREVQIGLIGAPWDGGTTNRPGPRHGPRQLRDASTMIRAQHGHTGIGPSSAPAAPIWETSRRTRPIFTTASRASRPSTPGYGEAGIVPLTAGGDHLVSLPVLRGLKGDTPLGMVHFDSHTDLFHSYFNGSMYTHGTPFRRAIEEGLLDPKRVVQIGIRGTAYDNEDRDFADAQGVRVIPIEEFFVRGVADVMAEAREIVGSRSTYVSYDIDFVDPAFAPGTGTPEVGGPSSFQALEVVRELAGLNLVGADLVEVSPPFDASGGTAWLGASLMFELLCVLTRSPALKA